MGFKTLKHGLLAILASSVLLTGCISFGNPHDKRAKAYMASAEEYQAKGLNDAALSAFALALEENPKLTDAYLGMGNIYREEGNLESASKSYEQAVVLSPNSFDAQYYLGLVRQLMDKYQEAIGSYLRALAINPDSFEANLNVGSAYLQLGRPEDALTYEKRATEIKHNSQAAWANLAAIYSKLTRYDEAIDAFREAAQYGDLAQPLLLGLADAHIHLGHFDRAKVVLDTILRQKPSCEAYERMGFVEFRQSKFDDALLNFRHALEFDANDVASLNGLGVSLITLYVQGGRASLPMRDEGIEAWRRSLQLRPDQPRIIDLLSRYQHL